MDWIIKPFEGAGPLSFDMSSEDAESRIGPNETFIIRPSGNRQEYRDLKFPVLTFDADNKLKELIFSKHGDPLILDDVSLFEMDPESVLKRLNEIAKELFKDDYSVYAPQIGLALVGFNNNEGDEKTVTLFKKGALDSRIPDAEPVSWI